VRSALRNIPTSKRSISVSRIVTLIFAGTVLGRVWQR